MKSKHINTEFSTKVYLGFIMIWQLEKSTESCVRKKGEALKESEMSQVKQRAT